MRGWGFVLALALTINVDAWAQAPKPFDPPRTTDGHPDFQGIWSSQWVTPLERESADQPLVLSRQEAEALEVRVRAGQNRPLQFCFDIANWEGPILQVRGDYRSSLIVEPANGKLPYNTNGRAAAQAWNVQFSAPGASDPEARGRTERCLGGVGLAPMQIRSSGMLRQIVQTPTHVVVLTEGYADLRIIAFGGPRPPPETLADVNESTARWDGDVLIVETRGLNPNNSVRGLVTVMSPSAVITERFEWLSPTEVLYRYTVDDPTFYSQAWTAEYVLVRTNERMYEFSCHEANYGLVNILKGSRELERRAAGNAKPR